MKRIVTIGVMMAWMMGASTAQAGLGQVDFFLTLEQQLLFQEPISAFVEKSSVVKIKVTTKDILAAFADHYGDTYPEGAVLNWGVMYEETEDAVGVLEVVNPLTTPVTVLREIEPTVFEIQADGLLPEGEGFWTLFSGTYNLVTHSENKQLASFLGYKLQTAAFDLRMMGILREKITVKEVNGERFLKASSTFNLLGEGYVGEVDPKYSLVSGKVTLTKEQVSLGVHDHDDH